jgi:hypothetical protein
MKWTPERIASVGYTLPIFVVGGIWYILLFRHNAPNPDYGEMLHTWFVEAPERQFFWWLALMPSLCLVLSAAYLSPIASRRAMALMLSVVGVAASIFAWIVFDPSIAIFVTLPLLFSVPRAWHLTIGAADASRRR